MIIGIDGNEANVEKKVGISEYAYELILQFANRNSLTSNLKFIVYLKDLPRGDLPKENKNWHFKIVKPQKLWTQIGLPIDLFISKPRPNVFFSPTHYAPRFSPVPTAISVMDLSFIHYPELFKKSDLYQLKNWTAYSAKKAKKIFTISKASKDDIIRAYKVPEDKVIVTYPGIKQILNIRNETSNMNEIRNKYGIEGEYILFVGTLQPRKNISKLVQAFSEIIKNKEKHKIEKNLQLVIVGKKGWLYEEIIQSPKKFHVEDYVNFLEYVPENDLVLLYQNAVCFVLPSLYEGFGLPVLEAMKNGCPVVTSNISSLPEAGGDAAIYFDPNNLEDMVAKINMVIDDEKLRTELKSKGYKQIKKFSWEETAKETLKVLEEISNSTN